MKFNLEDYTDEYHAMHCPEEWMAKMFCSYLHNIGKTWRSGNTYDREINYIQHGKATCYWFNNGQYGSLSYYKNRGYEILEFEEFSFGDKDESIVVDSVDAEKFNMFLSGFTVANRGETNA